MFSGDIKCTFVGFTSKSTFYMHGFVSSVPLSERKDSHPWMDEESE